MKRYKFEKKSLHVSRELIDKMTDACLTVPKITRAAISESAGVSLVTAGKFLTAMDECKFTYKKWHFPEDSRPSYCHTVNEALSILVIDTSSPSFSMSIVRGRSECRFYEQYDYDTSITFGDNLNLFLSRIGANAVRQPFGISAICILISDEKPTRELNITNICAATESDIPAIESATARFFGIKPLLFIKSSEAIASAIRHHTIKAESGDKLAHIYVGKGLSLSIYSDCEPICTCNIKNLLISGTDTLADLHRQMLSEDDLGKMLYKIVNFADCAFSPNKYVIEYDVTKFASIALKYIKRAFAAAGKPLPEITSINHSAGLAVSGAATLAAAELIKIHITQAE
ncbi:MAG: hypothetical protein IJ345_03195 [Clostridia bacterium]|nr:hypothetical protein [Clostridia bacterium]